MNDVPETVINRIAKLLALSKSENENEAASSMALAQNLLAKYQLDITDIQIEEKIDQEDFYINDNDRKKISSWQSILLNGISENNFCYVYRSGNIMKLIGKKSARHIVLVMFSYLISVIDNATEKAFQEYTGWEHGKTFKNSFRMGMVDRIITRLRQEAQKIAQEAKLNSKEIIPVDPYEEAKKANVAWIKSNGIHLRAASSSFRSGAGYNAGRSAGDKVSLSRNNALLSRN